MCHGLRRSEPLLRLLPQRGQACRNDQTLPVWSQVTPRSCLGWCYQRCLWGALPWQTDSLLTIVLLLEIELVILPPFLCEGFCFEGALVCWFTDLLCTSCFQLLEGNLTIAPTLRNTDKINLSLTKAVSYTHLTLPTRGSKCRSRWSPYH